MLKKDLGEYKTLYERICNQIMFTGFHEISSPAVDLVEIGPDTKVGFAAVMLDIQYKGTNQWQPEVMYRIALVEPSISDSEKQKAKSDSKKALKDMIKILLEYKEMPQGTVKDIRECESWGNTMLKLEKEE